MSRKKHTPLKTYHLIATDKRLIITIKHQYGEALEAAKLIPGGHVLEVKERKEESALRTASREHGYRPCEDLVRELGINWVYG